MKIIAWYLPQFHEIAENNEWWGKGFTDWNNVKKGYTLEKDHYQPKEPLNDNYYDLLDINVMRWQIDLAKKYGIYGFCMHHYWFDGKLLLQKPVEQYLENKSLDFPFCICWANEHWTNQWVTSSEKILIEQKYGDKRQWKQHFEYLLPFFQDKRYIRMNNKPFFIIYRPELIECLNDMLECWKKLAIENGLEGITFAYQGTKWDYVKKDDSAFSYAIEYQPVQCWNKKRQAYLSVKIKNHIPKWMLNTFPRQLNILEGWFANREVKEAIALDYDQVWQEVLDSKPVSGKSVPGAFVNWDNTARKAERGIYLRNVTPQKFCTYLQKQIIRTKKIYKKDFLFIFAWNEWAEGGYLEPDKKNQYAYLEAVRKALEITDEWER